MIMGISESAAREYIMLRSAIPNDATDDFKSGYWHGIETARKLMEKQFIERGYMPENGHLLLI